MKDDFSGNIERFSGFADQYDKYRPSPPSVLADLLTRLAGASRPALVVDLGSGTGLSSRYWADKAEQVIGVEPTLDMRKQAEAQTEAKNIVYREGFSHQTGLPDGCAQIVTCSQSLHWMEPQSTFEEAVRILVLGGVFAAYDYDWPPTTSSWEADAAYEECMTKVREAEKGYADPNPIRMWEKSQHKARMQSSGCFRYTKEVVIHHIEPGNAERLVGILLSQGSVMTLLKGGISESQIGIDIFRQKALEALGMESKPWYWCSRVRIGIA
jgi:SAM-dependent methyltransferase